VLQVTLLLFSAATATMASMDVIPRWVVSFTGFVATIAGGLLTTFKIQDRIYASRKAVAEVRLECQKYDRGIEEYKDMDTEKAFMKFSRGITEIQGQQMLQEVELWNPKKEEKEKEKTMQDNMTKDKENNDISENTIKEEKMSENSSGDE